MHFAGLIFDIGMFDGIDTKYFLKNNYQVIAVEADPALVKKATETFKDAIARNQLSILNYALSDEDGQELSFNISEYSFWNSLKPEVAGRLNTFKESIIVKSCKLSSLFEKYGVPVYCKVDIEGFDAICVSTLQNTNLQPKYISVETECIGENEPINEAGILKTLDTLKAIGYNQFKLVDQTTLSVLELDKPFYGSAWDKLNRLKNKYLHYNFIRDHKNGVKYNLFYTGASGVFGESLGGSKWYNYDDAVKLLLQHREQYFKLYGNKNKSFTFWCDWHGKFS